MKETLESRRHRLLYFILKCAGGVHVGKKITSFLLSLQYTESGIFIDIKGIANGNASDPPIHNGMICFLF